MEKRVPSHCVVPHSLHKLPLSPINWELGLSILLAPGRIAPIKERQESPQLWDFFCPWEKSQQSQDT